MTEYGSFQGGYSSKDATRDLVSALIFLIVVVGIMTVLIPFVMNFGSGKGALDSVNLQKLWTYGFMGVLGVIIFTVKIVRWATKGKHKWLDVTIFDPENSILGRAGVIKFFTKKGGFFITFLLFFLFFVAISGAISIAGAVARSSNFPNTAIPDVAFIEQSAWKTPAELALSVYPASPAEGSSPSAPPALMSAQVNAVPVVTWVASSVRL